MQRVTAKQYPQFTGATITKVIRYLGGFGLVTSTGHILAAEPTDLTVIKGGRTLRDAELPELVGKKFGNNLSLEGYQLNKNNLIMRSTSELVLTFGEQKFIVDEYKGPITYGLDIMFGLVTGATTPLTGNYLAITRDGQTLYYQYTPGPLGNDLRNIVVGIAYSRQPVDRLMAHSGGRTHLITFKLK